LNNKEKIDSAEPLSPEDAALWDRIAETAEPLRKGKNRVVERPEPVASPARDKPGSKRKPASETPRQPVSPPRPPAPAPVLPAANFERREVRALGSGRVSI